MATCETLNEVVIMGAFHLLTLAPDPVVAAKKRRERCDNMEVEECECLHYK